MCWLHKFEGNKENVKYFTLSPLPLKTLLPFPRGKGLWRVQNFVPLPLPLHTLGLYPQGFVNPLHSLLISSISGTERGEVRGVFWTDSGPCHVTHVGLLIGWLRWLTGWLIALLYAYWSLTDTGLLTDGLTNRPTKRLLGLLVILVRTRIYSLSSWQLSPKLNFVLIAAFWSLFFARPLSSLPLKLWDLWIGPNSQPSDCAWQLNSPSKVVLRLLYQIGSPLLVIRARRPTAGLTTMSGCINTWAFSSTLLALAVSMPWSQTHYLYYRLDVD